LPGFVIHRRGIRRTDLGGDWREAYAISKSRVKGTLPERVIYKLLTVTFKLVAGVDFDFQSSQNGGRLELGGIVADFLFPNMGLVIQVQGPTHKRYLNQLKDNEQALVLAEMGYSRVIWIEEDEIYKPLIIEDTLRRILQVSPRGGGDGIEYHMGDSEEDLTSILAAIYELEGVLIG
jgi:very-short-patch-repair endonuclease